ncbi:MAG: sigma-54-dependent Fis family transcriptional regulator [Myxococcales bacterium]|nr:sigma-54-dependent Fis family transcriptional regulator [Myxococcales bacterium]
MRKLPPRILLVEGDDTFGKNIARALRPLVLAAEATSDGGAAMARLTSDRFDAVVVDLELPPLGGWPILSLCASLPAPRPVILATGHVDVPTTVKAMRSGVADVVNKPYTAEQLLRQVEDALAAHAPAASPPPPKPAPLDSASQVLGDSEAMQRARDQIRNVARFPDLGVLILGESGTGKELVAEAVHELTSPDQPFVTVKCASIPDALFEVELFGHEASGAQGQRAERPGLIQSAGRGTLFLSEIEAVPSTVRAKLLRTLETRRYRRVGATRETEVRARVICATDQGGDDATLLEPFLHRLASFTIALPPLRARSEDIDLLASHFVEQLGARYDARKRLSQAALAALRAYDWPGNVRELRSVLEFAHVRAKGSSIEAPEVALAIAERRALPRRGDLGSGNYQAPFVDAASQVGQGADARRHSSSLRELERDLVVEAYNSTESISEAARRLGISRSTLREKLKKYGLR